MLTTIGSLCKFGEFAKLIGVIDAEEGKQTMNWKKKDIIWWGGSVV